MTVDEAWDITTTICTAANEEWPFDKLRQAIEPKVDEFTDQNLDAFSEYLTFTEENRSVFTENKDFLLRILDRAKGRMSGFRGSMRLAYLEKYFL